MSELVVERLNEALGRPAVRRCGYKLGRSPVRLRLTTAVFAAFCSTFVTLNGGSDGVRLLEL